MQNAIQVQAIDHINLSTQSLDKSLAFYRNVLGFGIHEDHRFDQQRPVPYVILHSGQPGAGALLAIYEEADTTQPEQPFISHWGFVVGDLQPVLETLQYHGMKPLYLDRTENGIVEYPHSRSVYIQDPDGHEIELVENHGGGV